MTTASLDLQGPARDLRDIATSMVGNLQTDLNKVPVQDTRRLTAESLSQEKIGTEGATLSNTVANAVAGRSSKEIGFIEYALDTLRGLFTGQRKAASKKEIREELKRLIPDLRLQIDAPAVHLGSATYSYNLTEVQDKRGTNYSVALLVNKDDDRPEILRISATSKEAKETALNSSSVPSLQAWDIKLSGEIAGEADTELFDLIQANPNILAKE